MNETASYALAALVLPPTSSGLLTLLGIALLKRRRLLALALIAFSALTLLALSMPVVAQAIARTLEPEPINLMAAHRQAPQAIAILGGGRHRGAFEWGGETVNHHTLQRLRYGATLARELSLPVLVSGGLPGQGKLPEAVLMRDVLVKEFNTDVRWVEEASLTTRENARLSAPMLKATGISRIVLVTDAAHMPRAQRNFATQGLVVIPAATGYIGQAPLAWNHLLPSVEGLRRSNIALREWLALVRDRVIASH